jgi:uncharacterized protein YndB with AHSA1/START domain
MKLIRSIARLIGTIMLLVVAFFLIGVVAPEVTIETSVSIKAEPVKVFYAITQPLKISRWMADFQSLELGGQDELRAGENFVLLLSEKETVTEIDGVVTALNSPERLEFAFTRTEASGQMTILIERIGNHSKLTATLKPKGTDWASRSAIPIIQSALEADLNYRFLALKGFLEN